MNEVFVPWSNDKNYMWTEASIKVMEVFGLPGDRYVTDIGAGGIRFFFNNNKDAFICSIAVSDYL